MWGYEKILSKHALVVVTVVCNSSMLTFDGISYFIDNTF